MGNIIGGAAGAGVGFLIGGPPGAVIGYAAGGAAGTTAEVINANYMDDHANDGGLRIESYVEDMASKGFKITNFWVYKCDLCYSGWNFAASTTRAVLCPPALLVGAEGRRFG